MLCFTRSRLLYSYESKYKTRFPYHHFFQRVYLAVVQTSSSYMRNSPLCNVDVTIRLKISPLALYVVSPCLCIFCGELCKLNKLNNISPSILFYLVSTDLLVLRHKLTTSRNLDLRRLYIARRGLGTSYHHKNSVLPSCGGHQIFYYQTKMTDLTTGTAKVQVTQLFWASQHFILVKIGII